MRKKWLWISYPFYIGGEHWLVARPVSTDPTLKVEQPQPLFALGAGRGRRPLVQKDGFVTSGVVGTIKERKLHSDPYFALFRKNFWRT